MKKPEMNSKEYWDDRFNSNWIDKAGPEQTAYFARLAIKILPESLKNLIWSNKLSILDWGCAQGQGTHLLAKEFATSKVVGLDFSNSAINTAKTNYPEIDYFSRTIEEHNQQYDIVFSSNCLEHFEQPLNVMEDLTRYAKHFLILLLPFQEQERFEEHVFTFDYEFFDLIFGNFNLVYHREIITSTDVPTFWPGKQILLVYIRNDSNLHNCLKLDLYKEYQLAEKEEQIINLETKLKNNNELLEESRQSLLEQRHNLEQNEKVILEQSSLIEQQAKELLSIQSEVEEKNKTIVSLEQELVQRNKEVQELHNSLISMSEWAHNLKITLDDINSWLLFRAIQKVKYYKKKVLETYSNQGLMSVVKKFVKHTVPSTIMFGYYHKKKKECFRALQDSMTATKSRIMIVFPIIPWKFRCQRPQHIVSRFANNGYTVIYLSMEMVPRYFQYNNEKEAFVDLSYSKQEKNIFEVILSSHQPINIHVDKPDDNDLHNLSLGLISLLKYLKPDVLTYMVQFPGWSPLVFRAEEVFRKGKIIFDCMDDHSGFSTTTDQALETERHLIEHADLVITSSSLLDSKARSINKNTILVRNGTEFEHFHNTYPNGKLDHLKKPVIGYYGAISDWFDMEIIHYCAVKKPEWNFVLIGSTFGADTSKVTDLANVHFLGEKPYKKLPGYLHYFDVCTIPFKIIPLTLATNPVKFYEYISSGKPVVSVKLPELEQYHEYCYLAENKENFLELLDKALAEKDESTLIRKRIELARSNSWQQRFEDINCEMEGLIV